MAIDYDPSELLKKIAPEAKIKRLLSGRVTLKKTALSFIDAIPYLDKGSVSAVALKTVKAYKGRIKDADRRDKREIKGDIVEDPRLLMARVQNEVIYQVKESIKENYSGEKYEWLPSDAEEPDPEHQLNYGEIFTVGEGEMPGDRIGCRCGMRILVKDTELELG